MWDLLLNESNILMNFSSSFKILLKQIVTILKMVFNGLILFKGKIIEQLIQLHCFEKQPRIEKDLKAMASYENLVCNFKGCFKQLNEIALITTCSHIFCTDHGKSQI